MLQSETVKKYDTYKDSGIEWIGEIPQEWTVGNLKRLTDFIKNGTSATQVENETEYKVSRIETISTGEINYSKTGYVQYFDNIDDYKLNSNDILFSNINSLEMVGNVAIYDNKESLYSGMNLLRISVNKNCCPKWLFYVLKNSYFKEQVKANAKHAINQVSISVGRLSQIPIIIPIKDEQQQIADYLDKKCGEIDKVVETEKSVIEKLKEYKQSIITEAVTKGLDKSVPLKDSGIEWIGKIPQHWDVCKLLKLYKERKCKNKGNIETNVLSLSYGNIKKRNVKNNMGLLPESFETYNIIIPNNIVLRLTDLQNDHKSLRCGLVKEQGIITSAYVTLEKKIDRISSNYYYRLLYTFDIMKGFYGMGDGVRQNLKYDGELCNLLVVKPPFEEQQQIAKYLDNKCSEIDKAIADKEQVIEKFTEYKKSLIYECVTGKRKVV
ncbi:MAG: restriction endonuclease subunit S [Candidatus Melainabacteria bacterium]|nr:MAG: restriction endonuclease subunit S [Candidatus Melainabacteria bacterium]